MLEYIPWIIAGVILLGAIALLILYLVEKKQHEADLEGNRRAVRRLENEKRGLWSELDEEQKRNEELLELLETVEKTHEGQDGRVGVFVFDRSSGYRLIGNAGRGTIAEAITNYEKNPLRATLKENCGKIISAVGGKSFYISEEINDKFDVYVAVDITDRERTIPELEKKIEGLRSWLADSDVLTSVLNLDALIEHGKNAVTLRESDVLMLRTELDDTPGGRALAGFSEDYLKECSSILLDISPDGIVGRASEDSFVCVLPRDREIKNEEILERINAARATLCPADERREHKNIIEIAHADDPESLRELVVSMTLKVDEDKVDGRYGVHEFDPATAQAMLERRDALDSLIEKERIRFGYRAFATGDEARVFGYELIPHFKNPVYETLEHVVREARIFGKIERLELKLFAEAMRTYKKAISDCKILYNTEIWLHSPKGAVMAAADEQKFNETYYNELKYLIVELDEKDLGSRISAELKHGRIKRWRSRTAIYYTGRDDLAVIDAQKPNEVRAPIELITDIKRKTELRDLLARLKKIGARLTVDGIRKPDEADAAIAAGASIIAGEYVASETDNPGEINDKCVKRIGQINFGKRK